MINRKVVGFGPKHETDPHEYVGLVHLPGLLMHDHQTLCGHCWNTVQFEDTTEPANCPSCIRTLAETRAYLRKRPRVKRKSV